jgi:hypothetical protein
VAFGRRPAGDEAPETKTTSMGRMKDVLRSAKITYTTGNLEAFPTDRAVLPVCRVQGVRRGSR